MRIFDKNQSATDNKPRARNPDNKKRVIIYLFITLNVGPIFMYGHLTIYIFHDSRYGDLNL